MREEPVCCKLTPRGGAKRKGGVSIRTVALRPGCTRSVRQPHHLLQTQRKLSHSPGALGVGVIMTDCERLDMTWGSSASSGYCSQSDSEHELELFYTARTSLRKTKRRKEKVRQRLLVIQNTILTVIACYFVVLGQFRDFIVQLERVKLN